MLQLGPLLIMRSCLNILESITLEMGFLSCTPLPLSTSMNTEADSVIISDIHFPKVEGLLFFPVRTRDMNINIKPVH